MTKAQCCDPGRSRLAWLYYFVNRGSNCGFYFKSNGRDFPGGPVVKNEPSNAGDGGLIPGRGTGIPHAAGQLSLRALEPARHN